MCVHFTIPSMRQAVLLYLYRRDGQLEMSALFYETAVLTHCSTILLRSVVETATLTLTKKFCSVERRETVQNGSHSAWLVRRKNFPGLVKCKNIRLTSWPRTQSN